jgi:hypothetical protein
MIPINTCLMLAPDERTGAGPEKSVYDGQLWSIVYIIHC